MISWLRTRVFRLEFILSALVVLSVSNKSFSREIKGIDIEGLSRIEKSSVLSKLPVKIGDDIGRSKINEALRKLYATQYFSDISIDIDKSGILKIIVEENPIVNSIIMGGIPKKQADGIKQEIKLQVRGVYTKEKVKEDSERIKGAFQKSGKLNTTVTPKIEILERNRVNVLFDVFEGEASRVDSVFFLNNELMKDKKILSNLTNKPSSSSGFKFFRGRLFEEDSIDIDKSAIITLYMNNGFADASINYVVSEYEKDTKNFTITFDINEGEKYRFGIISVESKIDGIDMSTFDSNVIKINEGDVFRNDLINRTITAISDNLTDYGYAFVKIDPIISKDKNKNIINIKFIIVSAFSVYVKKINILGTTRTHDYVIRRELLIKEGDLYSRKLVNKSRARLQILGYFDMVEIKEKKTEVNDMIELDVIVKDRKQTGNISFSIGYSTYEAFMLSAGISKANIMGRGYGGSISAMLSLWRRTLSLGFNNPHFLGTNLSMGFDIVYNNINPITSFGSIGFLPPYIMNSIMLAIRMGYPIYERLYHSWALQYRFDDVGIKSGSNVGSLYQDQLQQTNMSTSISHTLSYDKRDNGILPTRGYVLSITQNIALPLPYQFQYLSHDFYGALFIPIKSDKWVLSLIAKGGTIFDYQHGNVPYQYRYSLGYYNMRGFYYAGVGPHIITDTYDPIEGEVISEPMSYVGLRGNNYYVFSAELRMPTPLPKQYGLSFVAFIDTGASFGINGVPMGTGFMRDPNDPDKFICDPDHPYCGQDPNDPSKFTSEYVVDSPLPRVAIGGGILWMSPMGPIRLEFSYAAFKQYYDVPLVVRLHFSAMPI